jgi:hypothetical protein
MMSDWKKSPFWQVTVADNNKIHLVLQVPDIFARFFNIFGSSRRISIKSPVSHTTEIRPVGAALIHAERRTVMKKLICGFRNYENESTDKTDNIRDIETRSRNHCCRKKKSNRH